MNLLDRLVALVRREQPELAPVEGLSRRGFLKLLASSAAVAAAAPLLDLERVLWVPGQTIAVPAMGRNILLTAEWITREAMKVLENNLKMVSYFDREYENGVSMSTLMHPMSSIKVPEFGKATIADWEAMEEDLIREARMADAPLPIDALTNKVVLATEGQTQAYGVVNGGRMTFKVISDAEPGLVLTRPPQKRRA